MNDNNLEDQWQLNAGLKTPCRHKEPAQYKRVHGDIDGAAFTESSQLVPTVDFDFPADDCAGLLGSIKGKLADHDYLALSEAITALLVWATNVNLDSVFAERLIGRRALMLLWTLAPQKIDGEPSLSQLAARLGLSKASLSTVSAEVTRKFGITNARKSHGRHALKEKESNAVANN